MTTTSQVSFPVLITGRQGFFGFHDCPDHLVEKSYYLRHMGKVDWLKLVDRDFNLYLMRNLRAVRGAGRFGGYYFEGPFICRRLIYQADLEPVKRLSLDEIAEVLLVFMRHAQGYRKKDEQLFRQKFAEKSAGMKSLYDVRVFFEGLEWGDSSED